MIGASLLYRKGNFILKAALAIPDTGITVITGPSAAGKTTILKLIAGILTPEEGIITVSGTTWIDTDRGINLPPSARNAGYVFQDGRLFPHLSVEGNLRYGLKRSRRKKERLSFDSVIGILGLGELLQRNVSMLSGGQRQRVAIGRALLSQPDMLLMDEPLSSLDEEARANLTGLIRHIVREIRIPTLYVSHAQNEIVGLADHIIYIRDGEIPFQGALSGALLHPDLPYLHRESACSVIEGEVINYDEAYHLTTFMTPLGLLKVSSHPLKGKCRLVLHAHDISLSKKMPDASSISNHFTAIIRSIEKSEDSALIGTVRVLIEKGGVRVVATITEKSAATLDLRVGGQVHAQIKAISLKAVASDYFN